MINKIGRNDSCPCGSGNKYKKCCISTLISNQGVSDFSWRKLRQTEGSVVDKHLMPYTTQELPNDVIQTAISDFFPEDLPEAMDKELLFHNFFMPWLLFNWIPLEDFGVSGFESKKTIAQNYIKIHEKRLNSVERRFIDAMNTTYYSFYSLHEVELERALIVKDIMLGTMHTLKERQGTHQLKRGDVVFGRILTLDDQSIFVGMAPFIIPTAYHNNLIDFRKWLIEENDNQDLNAVILRDEFEIDLMDYFFEVMETTFNKPLPTLFNTDGELIQFSKSYFKLTIKPEDALHRLLPLTLSKDPKEFLQNAVHNDLDEINSITFPWLKKGNKSHKDWDNTVMGHITLENNKLILETNSEKRTLKGKKLLSKYLDSAVLFQQTLIESPEQKIRSAPETFGKNLIDPELLKLPEFQEQMEIMAKKHWDNWFDEPIPALDNRTPREAAKTEAGREKLEALLLQYEHHDQETRDNNLLKVDINYLRDELALE